MVPPSPKYVEPRMKCKATQDFQGSDADLGFSDPCNASLKLISDHAHAMPTQPFTELVKW